MIFKLPTHQCLWLMLGVTLTLALIDEQGNEVWEPSDTDRNSWLVCRGMPCDLWLARQKKMMKLKALELPDKDDDYYNYEEKAVKHPEDLVDETIRSLDLDECEWITEQEIDDNIEAEVKGLGKAHVRNKRRFHGDFGERQWDLPLHYKFDGTHEPEEEETIRKALRHIEANTCIRFKQLKLRQKLHSKPYVVFIKQYQRCHAWVGHQKDMKVQPINIQEECLEDFGSVVHEILHTLGMWHEEQRSDRDEYVKINYKNLKNTRSQFTKKVDTQSMAMPYDFGSVMHYAPKDLTKNGRFVIEPTRPQDALMKHTMGQRTGLSFLDSQLLNKAYCAGSCTDRPLAQPCERRGYQNPNDCTRCKCPNAYGGQFCETLHPSNADCGGDITVKKEATINTPNFPLGHYRNRMSCTWRFKAPENSRLQFEFEGPFSVFHKNKGVCYHWVEVLHKGNLDATGPRFCGYYRPLAKLVSDSNEMIVMLRANYTAGAVSERNGFKAKITVLKNDDSADKVEEELRQKIVKNDKELRQKEDNLLKEENKLGDETKEFSDEENSPSNDVDNNEDEIDDN